MPVSKKRKDIKHLSGTGMCKTIKGKQMQNGDFHVPELTRPFNIRAMMSKFPSMKAVIANKFHERQLKKQKDFDAEVLKNA